MNFENYYQNTRRNLLRDKENKCCATDCTQTVKGWVSCGLSDYAGYCHNPKHKLIAMNQVEEQGRKRFVQIVVSF